MSRFTLHASRFTSQGQASLEMTVALFGALLLMLACFKVFLWTNKRLVQRQQAYEATRVKAGQSGAYTAWQEPSERLKIFQADP